MVKATVKVVLHIFHPCVDAEREREKEQVFVH